MLHEWGSGRTQAAHDDQPPHHPWRVFRRLAHVRLRWADLPPGIWGRTDFMHSTVTIARGLTQAERRCTIAHETQHVLRGPVPAHRQAHEEREVDRAAARLLLPDVRAIGEALAWSQLRIAEAADELWVDEPTLRTRLDALHPAERAYLRRRLDEVDPAA